MSKELWEWVNENIDLFDGTSLLTDDGVVRFHLADKFALNDALVQDIVYNVNVGKVNVSAYLFRERFLLYASKSDLLLAQIPFWAKERLRNFSATSRLLVTELPLLLWDGRKIDYAVSINPVYQEWSYLFTIEKSPAWTLMKDKNKSLYESRQLFV